MFILGKSIQDKADLVIIDSGMSDVDSFKIFGESETSNFS